MKIIVCIRQGRDGEINPFDACALEEALKIPDAQVIMISMGIPRTENFLLNLTRLGAKEAYLLTDKHFAGSDTIATAYILSKAIEKLSPDLVFCGRQTLEGDTSQTGPMLAERLGYNLITNVMKIDCFDDKITCQTRDEGAFTESFPCLVTVERINSLRRPSIRSKQGTVTLLSAEDIGADLEKCGLIGSPTRVIESKENESGKRRCRFISWDELDKIIKEHSSVKLNNNKEITLSEKLLNVVCVGNNPLDYAKTVSEDIKVIPLTTKDEIAEYIVKNKPNAVLWGSDSKSKRLSALVASKLGLGLCADCTSLETDGEKLYMIRPALSGSVIAKIITTKKPAMATVRTSNNTDSIVVCAGYGVKDNIDEVRKFAEKYGASLAGTRKAVDNDLLPYSAQVGLTGKKVSPSVYIAVGVSGAVHHIVGMEYSGKVIAVNPDKNAPIFDYADFGIVGNFKNI